ncbi:non-specific lipid-transfer protein 1-like [Ananas comosus]|uniref:Non-specific lipid-transfer protein n=3 Tax=Ananas comosus TaxID=4615 RepID=A0A6P5HJM6_ANACO|nr:non-specific lipid-transfer protein 1-like [Ananas comosus]
MAWAAPSKQRAVVLCLLIIAAAVAPAARAAISCSDVYSELLPCLDYMQSGGAVPDDCCNGIRQLVASAGTTADRRAACGCIKSAASGVSGLNVGRAAALPKACGVLIPYKISPSTDCSKIN